jgi:hypothetical protein
MITAGRSVFTWRRRLVASRRGWLQGLVPGVRESGVPQHDGDHIQNEPPFWQLNKLFVAEL